MARMVRGEGLRGGVKLVAGKMCGTEARKVLTCCVCISVPDPQKHIQVSREFKDKVVEPILKVNHHVAHYCHMNV